MASDDLVQALEGLTFPIDHDKLIEYARNARIEEGALAALQEIPARQYHNMDQVLNALSEEAGAGQAMGEDWVSQWPELWQQAWRQSLLPLEASAEFYRCAMETWPQWLRLGQRLWMPWLH